MFNFIPGPLVIDEGTLAAQVASASTRERIERAEKAAAEARAAAPVVTGAYRDGIRVEVNGDDVALVDDDPKAAFKEYGTSDTPPHSVLTNAAAKLGRLT